jgi:GNAT superfamily N-acetyltransferase
MQIRELQREELLIITDLAHEIWPIAFAEILAPPQIDYMLNWMYSEDKLVEQFDNGHHFFGGFFNGDAVGFMGIEPHFPSAHSIKIHKLYVLPTLQGQGYGKSFIEQAKMEALKKECTSLILNVNRFNKAVQFYKHLGFSIVKEEDIDIGNGYLMEDYVMEQKL